MTEPGAADRPRPRLSRRREWDPEATPGERRAGAGGAERDGEAAAPPRGDDGRPGPEGAGDGDARG